MKYIFVFLGFLFVSCGSTTSGVDGENNSNNTINIVEGTNINLPDKDKKDYDKKAYCAFELGYAPLMILQYGNTGDTTLYNMWRSVYVECAKNFGYELSIENVNSTTAFTTVSDVFVKMSASENAEFVPYLQLSYNFVVITVNIKNNQNYKIENYTDLVENANILKKHKEQYYKIIKKYQPPIIKNEKELFLGEWLVWMSEIRIDLRNKSQKIK